MEVKDLLGVLMARRLLNALLVTVFIGGYTLYCIWIVLFFITDFLHIPALQNLLFLIVSSLVLLRIFYIQCVIFSPSNEKSA